MSKFLRNIRNERFAITGEAWVFRNELKEIIRDRGGEVPDSCDVSGQTTVLIKGTSGHWSFGDHGVKEAKAAALIRAGHQIMVVTDAEFKKLVTPRRPAKALDRVAGEPIEWLKPPSQAKFKKVANISGPLDREQTGTGRVEQGYLRARLFNGQKEAKCAICHRRLPTNLLIAAHIKPRAECSRRERLDADRIVFPVCLFGCDALYERGMIAIEDNGKIVVADANGCRELGRALNALKGKTCPVWREENARYFAWHLKQRFQG